MLTTTLCAALSAAGLAVAVLTAYRRRYLAATRMAALALLPVGLAMAGLVTLGRKIATAVGDWSADLIFKPTVWTGFGVLACSALLYGVTRLFGRRKRGEEASGGPGAGSGAGASVGGRSRGEAEGRRAPAAASGGSAAAITAGRGSGRRKAASDSGLSDFADVEEILKRRGI
ncbi:MULTISPECIES: hypothetical protein [unclassified Streptomyces]|uniref:hypothetical protein n=1 Tax=unclassified Streptomyces TaxID=2593676 RepID=UPI002E2C0447|nr:hypothetical protein [Streptomyces sp. NBC_00223]